MFRDNNYVYLWNQDILNYNYHSLNGRCSPRTSCFIFAVLRKWSVTLAYVYKQSRHRTFNFITKINTITKKPLSLFPARPDLFLNNRFLNKIQFLCHEPTLHALIYLCRKQSQFEIFQVLYYWMINTNIDTQNGDNRCI